MSEPISAEEWRHAANQIGMAIGLPLAWAIPASVAEHVWPVIELASDEISTHGVELARRTLDALWDTSAGEPQILEEMMPVLWKFVDEFGEPRRPIRWSPAGLMFVETLYNVGQHTVPTFREACADFAMCLSLAEEPFEEVTGVATPDTHWELADHPHQVLLRQATLATWKRLTDAGGSSAALKQAKQDSQQFAAVLDHQFGTWLKLLVPLQ